MAYSLKEFVFSFLIFFFFAKKGYFVTFDLGGPVTLWFAISPPLNILTCLTHQKIGNFKDICISTISRYIFCGTFAFLSCTTFFFLGGGVNIELDV